MDIGIRLSTAVGTAALEASALADRAATIEEHGLDGIWCMDHLLKAGYALGAATLDPVTVLPVLLTATRTITVGTALLIGPLREPVWLLKQLGSLSALGGERVAVGLGGGWDEREFAAVGVPRSQRRQRFDSVMQAIAMARNAGEVRIAGELIEPAPSRLGAVYVGGGSSTVSREGRARQLMAPSVLARIAAADGWIARSTATPEQISADLRQILGARRRPDPFPVLRTTFLHLSERADRDAAVAEQLAAFRQAGFSGSRGDFEHAELAGTIDDVATRISTFAGHGVSGLIVQPVGDFGTQISLLASELRPRIRALQPTVERS